MKVEIVKYHPHYEKGVVDVSAERGDYLILIGVAEEIKEKSEHKKKNEKAEGVKHTSKSEK